MTVDSDDGPKTDILVLAENQLLVPEFFHFAKHLHCFHPPGESPLWRPCCLMDDGDSLPDLNRCGSGISWCSIRCLPEIRGDGRVEFPALDG